MLKLTLNTSVDACAGCRVRSAAVVEKKQQDGGGSVAGLFSQMGVRAPAFATNLLYLRNRPLPPVPAQGHVHAHAPAPAPALAPAPATAPAPVPAQMQGSAAAQHGMVLPQPPAAV